MKLKNLAYATFVGAAAVAFVIGSAVPSEAAKKKGGSRAAAAAPAGRVRRRTCSGVRNQGRHELHLSQCLLGRERRRESCQAGRMQRGQDGRRQEKVKEEEGVIRNSV